MLIRTRRNERVNSIPASEALVPSDTTSLAPCVVLCDLDGTLLDTERTWLETVCAVVADLGGIASAELISRLEGATVAQAGELIRAELRSPLSERTIGELLEEASLTALEGTIEWCPGAEEMLAGLRAAGIPMALVTSSSRRWLETAARHVDLSAFSYFVTADDVPATKPDPAPYRIAASLLGRESAECVVFEDSEVGLRAALAAGCTAVLVRAEDTSWAEHADAVVPDLRGATPVWVRALAARRPARR
nr:HAD family phosphatase [Leucobacter chromiireducens]